MEQQETPKHTAHVGEMRHIAYAAPAEEKFDDAVDDDEPFGLHRDRRDQQHDDRIGVHDAEGEHQPATWAARRTPAP